MSETISMRETRNWRRAWRTVGNLEILLRIADDRHRCTSMLEFFVWAKRNVRYLLTGPDNHFFEVRCDGRIAGGFFLKGEGAGSYEVHTMLRKDFRGRVAIAIWKFCAATALSWPWVNRLTSYCPVTAPETFLFARLCGFRHVGTHARTWLKNGVEHAMKAVELNKGDLCPC